MRCHGRGKIHEKAGVLGSSLPFIYPSRSDDLSLSHLELYIRTPRWDHCAVQ